VAKKSIWTDNTSRYGTYEGPRGTPESSRAAFDAAFANSTTVKSIALQGIREHAFTIFNLPPSASEDDIKREFRRKIKIIGHPDRGGDRTAYENCVQAYQLLMGRFRSIDIDQAVRRTPRPPTSTPREVDPDDQPTPSSSQLIIPQLLSEITEEELDYYLFSDEWCAQEKKDGRHLTLRINNGQFEVRNKKGDVSSCEPAFENSLRVLGKDILVDGEHIKNTFWVWDILEFDCLDLRGLSYQERYNTLLKLKFGPSIKIVKSYTGSVDKKSLFERLAPKNEGIVFKRLAATFTSGKGPDQVKYKFYAEASVIVIAGRPGKASIGMELFNAANVREFVGFCSCSTNPPLGSVAEIKYLYAYHGGCLIQPSFKELRDDVSIEECTLSQLKYKSEEE
jgi:bifunctional non-homologous end joining protein LigD